MEDLELLKVEKEFINNSSSESEDNNEVIKSNTEQLEGEDKENESESECEEDEKENEEKKNNNLIPSDNENNKQFGGEEEKELLIKELVDEFCKLDNERLQLKEAIKLRDTRIKELKLLIGEYMSQNSIDFFNLKGGGSICYNEKLRFVPLKKSQQSELFTLFLKDTEKASELSNFLKENREKIMKSEVKRKN